MPIMQRRAFLNTVGGALYALIAIAVGIPALRFLLGAPRRSKDRDAFLRIAMLESVAAGRPTRVTINADRWDAYVHHPPGPIGSVWLLRGEGDERVRCLQVICPHLGCGIDYSADRGAFACPCHASEFDAAGLRHFGPSPRDMDELPCRVTAPDEHGARWVEVQYAEFQTGLPDKRPLA